MCIIHLTGSFQAASEGLCSALLTLALLALSVRSTINHFFFKYFFLNLFLFLIYFSPPHLLFKASGLGNLTRWGTIEHFKVPMKIQTAQHLLKYKFTKVPDQL